MWMKPKRVNLTHRKPRTGDCTSVLRWRERSRYRSGGRGYVIYSASRVPPLHVAYLWRVRVIADPVCWRAQSEEVVRNSSSVCCIECFHYSSLAGRADSGSVRVEGNERAGGGAWTGPWGAYVEDFHATVSDRERTRIIFILKAVVYKYTATSSSSMPP